MARGTVTNDPTEELLERLRSRRRLPMPAERRRIREAARVSVRQLAAAIPPAGVSPMAIVRWEAGSVPRNPAHMRAYARLLDELQRLGDDGAAA